MVRRCSVLLVIMGACSVAAFAGNCAAWADVPSQPAIDRATREVYHPVREKVEQELITIPEETINVGSKKASAAGQGGNSSKPRSTMDIIKEGAYPEVNM